MFMSVRASLKHKFGPSLTLIYSKHEILLQMCKFNFIVGDIETKSEKSWVKRKSCVERRSFWIDHKFLNMMLFVVLMLNT